MNNYSIWLIPQKKDKKIFEENIIKISKKYNSPKFIPHITLIPKIEGSIDDISEKILKAIQNNSSFNLEFNSIKTTDNYWRSVFLEGKKSEKLSKLYESVKTKVKTNILNIDKEYYPHFSLIYGDYSNEQKKEIISLIKYKELPKEILIDRISLIDMNSENPSKWIVLQEYKLK